MSKSLYILNCPYCGSTDITYDGQFGCKCKSCEFEYDIKLNLYTDEIDSSYDIVLNEDTKLIDEKWIDSFHIKQLSIKDNETNSNLKVVLIDDGMNFIYKNCEDDIYRKMAFFSFVDSTVEDYKAKKKIK
jgi:hypothetical protein